MLLMIGAMLGAFLTSDAFIFYIFYEVALIPIYFMILIWGNGDNRAKVTMKFFVYTIFGSLFMLVSLLYVYQHTTPSSFSFVDMYEAGKSLSAVQQGWVFAGIFIAFAVKKCRSSHFTLGSQVPTTPLQQQAQCFLLLSC
ncbi:MAG: proton-conducting transporter membrane subunit [Flavobacteriales bacterium]